MSLDTTRARAEAAQWDRLWSEHKKGCPPCQRASHSWLAEYCEAGDRIKIQRRDANEKLRKERELDRQPVNMTPLFTVEECR